MIRHLLATVLATACTALLSANVLAYDAGPNDHTDGVGDSLFLFNTNNVPGIWILNPWVPSGSPSHINTAFQSGGFAGLADGTLNGGPANNIPLTGDINGDGIADIVASGTNVFGSSLFIGRNTGVDGSGVGDLSEPPVGDLNFPGNFAGVGTNNIGFFLGDLNGDGIDDAIGVGTDTGPMIWEARQSDSLGMESTGAYSFAAFGGPADGIPFVGDFNGDGLTDVGHQFVGTPTGFVQVLVSKGGGLNSSPAANQADLIQGAAALESGHLATLVGDLNGDGLDDLVSVDDRDSNGSLYWTAALTGVSGATSGFGIAEGGTSTISGVFAPNTNDISRIPMLADINGDGRDDLVLYHEYTNPGDLSGGTDEYGEFLVAYSDVNGDLANSLLDDQVSYNLTAVGNSSGNIPLAGQVHPAVPEPSSLLLLVGMSGLVTLRRKRSR